MKNINLTTCNPLSKRAIRETIEKTLKIPKNYRSRIGAQLKRNANTKTIDELKEMLVEDWEKQTTGLADFWESLEKLQNDLAGQFYENQALHQNELSGLEFDIVMARTTFDDALKISYHEYRKKLITDYIALGLAPSDAAKMVLETNKNADALEMIKIYKKACQLWHGEVYQ